MKKHIPQRVVNKAIVGLFSSKNKDKQRVREYAFETLFSPNTANTKISNKFFKNSVSKFVYKCNCDGCLKSKTTSTRRKIEKLSSDLNDYLQEK